MEQKTSTQAVLALMQDAQSFKRIYQWRKPVVEFYSDYIDVEYHIKSTVRAIPENKADEWRMFAIDDELVLVFTYYYKEEDL